MMATVGECKYWPQLPVCRYPNVPEQVHGGAVLMSHWLQDLASSPFVDRFALDVNTAAFQEFAECCCGALRVTDGEFEYALFLD